MPATIPPVPPASHRVVKVQEETSQMLALMSKAVINLDTNRQVWYDILNCAKEQLEATVREAATTTSLAYGLASPYFQQKVLELNIRIEILEELVGVLPLRDPPEQDNH